MMKRVLVSLLSFIALVAHAASTADLLEPEKAFRLSARAIDADGKKAIEIRYAIADGYYLYRERFKFESPNATLGGASFPAGHVKEDQFFGKVETYRKELAIRLALDATSEGKPIELAVTSQGCADIGVCYPPTTQVLRVGLDGGSARELFRDRDAAKALPSLSSAPALSAAPGAATASSIDRATLNSADDRYFAGILESGKLITILGFFFVAGLALTFTPCVLPMVPILAGIIAGKGRPSRAQALGLSSAYVFGMALTYTAIGIAAALTGSLLSAALQNAWVLGAFALLFVLLSLAMFGLYELRLPSSLVSRISTFSNRLSGGRIGAVAAMGAISAAIVSPCVAAPLAGALLYISQTHDAVLGGSALFAMALGMGVPLILIGTFEGALLPKSGAWMNVVKQAFGVLLLGVAIWIVSPVLPAMAHLLAWAALLIGTAVFLRAIDPLPVQARAWTRLGKALGVLMLIAGAALAIGAFTGANDPLRPLAGLRNTSSATSSDALTPSFERITTLAALETRTQQLAVLGRPAMLDFYADWCVSCKEMERFTFSDPAVRAKLADFALLQVDVTANNTDDRALLRRFKLFGPPGIVFFDANGHEIESLRVIGYQPAQKFAATLDLVR